MCMAVNCEYRASSGRTRRNRSRRRVTRAQRERCRASTVSSTLLDTSRHPQPLRICSFNGLALLHGRQRFGRHVALTLGAVRKAMLKISTIDTRSERRLVVEGKLIEPWIAELEKTWSVASENLEGRKLVIDLSNAIVISREGEDALLELMKKGAKFSCCGVLTRYLIRQMAQKCGAELRKCSGQTTTEKV